MENYGFLRVAAASPRVHVADPDANVREMTDLINKAALKGVSLVVFPELGITGYTCADLFGQSTLIKRAEKACVELLKLSSGLDCVLVFGLPLVHKGRLYNCAVVARNGKILGIVPKIYLAGNGEFYEPRWFESATKLPEQCIDLDYAGQKAIPFGVRQIFKVGKAIFGVEICQDLWAPVPPSTWAALNGAQVIVNLTASNEVLMKHEYRKLLLSATSSRLFSAYVYSCCTTGESTQDLVWAGSSLIYENGTCIAENERFQREFSLLCGDIDIEKLDTLRTKEHAYGYCGVVPEYELRDAGKEVDTDFNSLLLRHVEAHPFVPKGNEEDLNLRCREILATQVQGLCSRLEHIGCKKVVIGVSGGLDSTLALIVSALALDKLGLPRKNLIALTMPGFGTSSRTYDNSSKLMELLGCDGREISIIHATRQHFQDLGHSENEHDLTYENSQARERTQLLMDLAGKEGGIVVGTGDLSELALGWCTYNGDHMSMYGVNASIPKTLVRTLVVWAANNSFGNDENLKAVLLDVADTPISPELVPLDVDKNIAQKTEELIGPYELHDFFLYNFFRWGYSPSKLLFLASKAFEGVYDVQTIKKWLSLFMKRFFTQQFKRSCLPDGPKVGSVSLSPRGDWRMPSDLKHWWEE